MHWLGEIKRQKNEFIHALLLPLQTMDANSYLWISHKHGSRPLVTRYHFIRLLQRIICKDFQTTQEFVMRYSMPVSPVVIVSCHAAQKLFKHL